MSTTLQDLRDAGISDDPRPWLAGTIARIDDGQYADYLAWEDWMRSRVGDAKWWKELSILGQHDIYSAMIDCCLHCRGPIESEEA